jgi:PAS domain S-box-containing protein
MRNLSVSSLVLLLILSLNSYADNKTLIVGSEQDYPPFALGLTDATADGFTVELWRAVAAESHLASSIRVLPFHEVLQQFKAGKIDVLINLAQSEERRQFADFTVPHVIVNGAVFVREGENSIHSEADLKQKTIIVLNADLAHDYAVTQGWQKQLRLVETPEAGFKLLASGQGNAMLLSKLAGQQTLEKLKLTEIEMLPIKVGFAQKFSFAVKKGNAELLAKINEGLAVTKANGVYDKLYEKWFGIYEEKALRPLLIKYLALVITIFVLIMLVFLHRRAVERKHANALLRKSEARFRNTFEYAPIGVVNMSLEGKFLIVNQTFCDILGYSKEELLTMQFLDVIQNQDKAEYTKLNQKLINGEIKSIRLEKQFLRRDRRLVWGSLSTRLSHHSNGLPDYLITTVEDISPRKQIQQEILATKNQLESTLNAIPDLMFEVSLAGYIFNYHAHRAELLAVPPEQFLAKKVTEVLPTDVTEIILSALQQAQQQGWSVGKQYKLILPNHDTRWFELSVAIKNAEDNQSPHFIMLARDITERKQTEVELHHAKEQAIAANLAKTEFLSNMSHEIRTPMNAILGFSSILKDLITDPTQKYYLEAVDRCGKILLQLINDVLDLSKIEADKFHLHYSPVSIKRALDDIHLAFMHKAADKNLDFSIQLAENLPEYLLLDEIRLRQVLLNLIGNAVKFTHRGFIKIKVLYYPVANNHLNLKIEIHDSGIGIAKNQQEKIFTAFTQQDNQDVIYGGTGLGLTICKRLLELMHGTISVESEEGKGSCFTLTLNNIEIAAKTEAIDDKAPTPIYKNFHFQPAKILIVDDIEINRQLIKSYLTSFSELTLIEAKSGTEALNLARQQQFNLILMDKKLPDQKGDLVCQKIKALPNCAAIPIIMITASVLKEQHQESAMAFDMQLNKPLKKQELIAAMQSFLAVDKNTEIALPAQHTLPTSARANIETKDLPKLLALLASRYQNQITKLQESSIFQIDEFIELADELLETSVQYPCQPLTDWANTLKNQAILFDLENLPKTLNGFTTLIQQLKINLQLKKGEEAT